MPASSMVTANKAVVPVIDSTNGAPDIVSKAAVVSAAGYGTVTSYELSMDPEPPATVTLNLIVSPPTH